MPDGSLCINLATNKHGHVALAGLPGTFDATKHTVASAVANFRDSDGVMRDHSMKVVGKIRLIASDGSQACISLKGLGTGVERKLLFDDLTSGTLTITLAASSGSPPVIPPINPVIFVNDPNAPA